jgi:hypothetical protein
MAAVRKSTPDDDPKSVQSTIRRVNAPASMPSMNALESARKRNVPTSSSQPI